MVVIPRENKKLVWWKESLWHNYSPTGTTNKLTLVIIEALHQKSEFRQLSKESISENEDVLYRNIK